MTLSSPQSQILCWHALQLLIPTSWNPVRIEGDAKSGFIGIADLHGERLGVRWESPRTSRGKGKSLDVLALSERAMRSAVGVIESEKAKPHDLSLVDCIADTPTWQESLLYVDDDPPARHVWTGYSPASGRVLTLVYKPEADAREGTLRQLVLPSLRDLAVGDHGNATRGDKPSDARDGDDGSDAAEARGEADVVDDPGGMIPWSIYELSCRVPATMSLAGQSLLAGDLGLSFVGARARRELSVRQVAIARVALAKLPLRKWLARHMSGKAKHYRLTGPAKEWTMPGAMRGEAALSGWTSSMTRRRRYVLMRRLPKSLHAIALHDVARDRLVFVRASDFALAEKVAASVGWARRAGDVSADALI